MRTTIKTYIHILYFDYRVLYLNVIEINYKKKNIYIYIRCFVQNTAIFEQNFHHTFGLVIYYRILYAAIYNSRI